MTLMGCSERKNKPISKNDQSKMSTEAELNLYADLASYIDKEVLSDFDMIADTRKAALAKIAAYVSDKKAENIESDLNFICTHNSRRSHISQIWAATAAAYYGFSGSVNTYSGGTEATAFNPRAVAAIQRAGFMVENPGGENPRYAVTFESGSIPMLCYSKKYDDQESELAEFVAVMTCSEADQNCPYIPNTKLRVSIPYEDPKVADGTEYEAERYDERCKQIATEMFYMMSLVK